jgi:hypothetical protein
MNILKYASIFLNLCFIFTVKCSDLKIKTADVTWTNESLWKNSFGSCGFKLPPDPYTTAALTQKYMALPANITNPNQHPFCFDTCVFIQGPLGSVVMQVGDTIEGDNDNLNVADSVFKHLADLNLGRVQMLWKFVDCKTHLLGPLETLISKGIVETSTV